MKSQQGFIVLGGLYFLVGALLTGTFAAVDIHSKDKAQAVAAVSQDAKAPPIADAVVMPTMDTVTVVAR
jgi:hypothetical protein